MQTDKTGIMVAAHFECEVPDDEMYIPVMAGSVFRDYVPAGYVRDDTGDNISDRNASFCELTALYWGWKNLDIDIIGLCHYRRFFASPHSKRTLLKEDEASHLLNYYDVILPKARNYLIESNYSQYVHSHNEADLKTTRSIIEEKCPEYIDAYDRRMAMTTGHRFNMLIMKKDLCDRYCSWLFGILFELEKKLDISDYNTYDKRVFGFAAERLLDVWIDANDLRSVDLDYIFTGNEHLLRKAAAMTVRKLKAFAVSLIKG